MNVGQILETHLGWACSELGDQIKEYLKNFDKVEEKMENVVERDAMRSFQSPLRGGEIMELCGLVEGRIIGEIKTAIEEAILDGDIKNNHESALEYLHKIKGNYLN